MDLKLLEHAKSYIDALARGVNPLTGEEIPENEIVNQVRISRCLYYVSDVLTEVLQNGSIRRAKTEALPFDPAQIDFSAFPYDGRALTVSNFAAAVNALKSDEMKKLKVTAVTSWLAEHGYLRVETVNNKSRKRLAAAGTEIGILEHEYTGEHGRYFRLLYSESAQYFLIAHLPEIIAEGFND